MPNLNGTGPFGDPNWICRRTSNVQSGNFARGGKGNFCRAGKGAGMGVGMGMGMGAGRGARFNQGGYNANYAAPVEAQTDTAAEISALKEKISSLEDALNKMRPETGE